jgi:hypothetical protein
MEAYAPSIDFCECEDFCFCFIILSLRLTIELVMLIALLVLFCRKILASMLDSTTIAAKSSCNVETSFLPSTPIEISPNPIQQQQQQQQLQEEGEQQQHKNHLHHHYQCRDFAPSNHVIDDSQESHPMISMTHVHSHEQAATTDSNLHQQVPCRVSSPHIFSSSMVFFSQGHVLVCRLRSLQNQS